MVLVDTTVLIDTIKGTANEKSILFQNVMQRNLIYGISEYTYLEILQGAKSSSDYNYLNEYLLDMNIYFLPKTIETYEKAANIYFTLRRQGITPRSTIDILIALTAIEYNLSLLHNDKDFDAIEGIISELGILR